MPTEASIERDLTSAQRFPSRIRSFMLTLGTTSALMILPSTANAQLLPPPSDSSIVDVCSGVSLPASTVTDIVDDVVLGIYNPVEGRVNGILSELGGSSLLGLLLPDPLSVNVSQLLQDAADGDDITLSVIADDGTLVGPSSQCDARADSFSLDTPAGLSIGGNRITGLGGGAEAFAATIDAIAFGNGASTDAGALAAVAIGSGASVSGANSVALGAGAGASGANSVALGAGSLASRGPVAGVSVGEISVGSPGNERQITNVAAGTQATDAVNLGQLQAAIAGVGGSPINAVLYANSSQTLVTLGGSGGTRVTNVADGSISATSSDAVNGSQLFATNSQVTNNSTAIANLQVQIDAIDTGGGSGEPMPVHYSDPATPNVPNGGTPTNDATLVGASAGPVGLHNVAEGEVAAGSTDAVNGGQLAATNASITDLGDEVDILRQDLTDLDVQLDITNQNVTSIQAQIDLNTTAITNLTQLVNEGGGNADPGPVRYSDAGNPEQPNDGTVTNDVMLVGADDGPVGLHNVADGEVAAGSNDAVNGGQLFAVEQDVVLAQATADDAIVAADAAQDTADQAISDAADAQDTADDALALAENSVQYADSEQTRVRLGDGSVPVALENVADGEIAEGSTDAVNGGQVFAIAQNAVNAVTYDTDDSGQRVNRITLNGGDVGPIRISNVAAGVSGTDAVNVSQLQGAVQEAAAYTDLRFEQIAFDLETSIDDAAAGTAAAMAHGGMPRAMDPGKVMVSGGFGVYRGQTGFAFGSSYRSENGDTVFNAGVSYDSQRRVGASGGFGIQF